MRKTLIILIAVIATPVLAWAAFQWNGASVTVWNGASVSEWNGATVSGGASCQASPFFSDTNNDAGQNVGDYAPRTFQGIFYDTVSKQRICKVDVYVRAKSGTKDWRIEVWQVDSGTYGLATLVGYSNNVASSSITTSAFNTFTFSTPSTAISARMAIVLTTSDNTTGENYLEIGMDTGMTSASPHYMAWYGSKALSLDDDTKCPNFKVYAYE